MKNIKKILKTVAIAIMLSILVMIFYSVRNVDLSEMPDKKSIAFETTQFSVKLFNPDTTLRFKIDSGFFYVLEGEHYKKLPTGLETISKPVCIAKPFLNNQYDSSVDFREEKEESILLVFIQEDGNIMEGLYDIKQKEVVSVSMW